jgi:hypothetical protein
VALYSSPVAVLLKSQLHHCLSREIGELRPRRPGGAQDECGGPRHIFRARWSWWYSIVSEHAVVVSEFARSILSCSAIVGLGLQATGRSNCCHYNLGSGGVVTKLCVGHGSSYRHEDRVRGRRFHFRPPLRLQRVMSSRVAYLPQVWLSASSSAMSMVALFSFMLSFTIDSFFFFLQGGSEMAIVSDSSESSGERVHQSDGNSGEWRGSQGGRKEA